MHRSAWRRRWSWLWVGALVVVLIGLGAWGALAAIRSPTSQPLPGSQFQGGDGDQANSAGLIDWQGLHADGVVAHTSDPNATDNVFSGGDKEGRPDDWSLGTSQDGANPASENILDTYRAVDHPSGGDVFLYLAFTREAASGTTFAAFELNQDPRLWTNAGNSKIPCRTTGDILVTFGDHGNQAEVGVERWITGTRAPNGCARTGHLADDTRLTGNDIQASFNNASQPITNYLPGSYGTRIDTGLFAEVAINLSNVLGHFGDPCVSFASTWMHSRSSLSSDDSALKDYVSPESFTVRTCKASPAITSSASGTVSRKARGKHRLRRRASLRSSPSISDTATLSGGSSPTGTIEFRLFGPNDGDCSGPPAFLSTATVTGNGSYQSGSFAPAVAGTYRWVVEYSGDANNDGAGPTACGKDAETVVINKATPTLSSTASGSVELAPRRRRRRDRRVRVVTAPSAIYDTAELEGARAPSGTLTFKLYGPDDPTCSGGAIFTSPVPVTANGLHNSDPFTPTTAGSYRWRVSYSGDANNEPIGQTDCGIDAETVVVSPAKPTLVTEASPAVRVGGAIFDHVTLSNGSHPTGTIVVKAYGPRDANCSGPPAHTSTIHVSGNHRYSSADFSPTVPGIYRWIATYSGDGNNDPVATSCGDPGEQVVVFRRAPPPPPVLTTTAPTNAHAGATMRDKATLSEGSQPTGTITFRVYGPGDDMCSGDPAAVSSVRVLRGNGSYRSRPFTPTRVGTYRWVASYSGDENNGAVEVRCNDSGETVNVSKAEAEIRTLALRVRPIGLAVRDVAHISSGADPRGRIIFRLFGPGDDTCSQPPAFAVSQRVIGNGLYPSPEVTPTLAGTYRWIATYTGDRNNFAASSPCGQRREVARVLPRRPVLTTSASPPAYVHRAARRVQTAGGTIYDAARLRHGFAPTGEITFALYGPGDASCSRTPTFTSATIVNGNGIYNSARFAPVASGTYRWVATYSGDANNRGAGPTRCGDTAERVRVTVPADPVLTTSASEAATLGGAIHDTAHLSSGARPTGTITFRLYAPNDSTCAGHPVFKSTVNVSGNDDYDSQAFVPKQPGAYQWVANYSGDSRNHRAGPTACLDTAEVAVVRPPAIVPVVPALSTSASVSTGVGAPLVDVAHLRGGIAPFGTITFSLFGPDDLACSKPPAFTTTAAVNGDGDYRSAAFSASAPGTYRWVVTYSGDAVNSGVGPTACGEPTETTSVSATPSPIPEHGPNVPNPSKPKRKPAHKVKPPPPPPSPVVTG